MTMAVIMRTSSNNSVWATLLVLKSLRRAGAIVLPVPILFSSVFLGAGPAAMPYMQAGELIRQKL